MHRQHGKKYMAEVCLNTRQKNVWPKIKKPVNIHQPSLGYNIVLFVDFFFFFFFFNVQTERVQCAIDWPYTLKQYIFIYPIF
jgi:hypothetical protein